MRHVSPVKRCYGNQNPWKSVVGEDRLGQPGKETESFSSTDYSKLDYDRVWSSQERKAEATTHDRSGQPDKTSWRMVQQVRPDHEATLLDGTAQSVRYGEPLRDRSGQPDNINSQETANSQNFIVRKRQKRISNVAEEGEEHSIIWGMFIAVTMNSATFMGKNFQDNQNSIVNTTDLTLKKMFDTSAKLV